MARSMRPFDVTPITTRTLQVLRVADVTPGMRRVTLGGPGLAAFTADTGYPVGEFRANGFDDEFKILLQHPDAAETVAPTQADGVLNWPRGNPHLVVRTYTARRWDPEQGELDVDFVMHGVGPATSWARRVQPGESVPIAGPKMSGGHPQGADWVLIAGDETALPSIGRWLEEWPAGQRAQVFIEVAEDSHRQDVPAPEGVEVNWLIRDGAEAGTTTLLYDAITSADWWDGRPFAWVAGETLTLVPIRRWLKQERGLDREQVEVTGYWRRQEVQVSEEDPEMPDLEAESDAERFHELVEIVPGFAVRVAVTIGVGDALENAPATTEEIVRRTGADPAGLAKLLRYLEAIEILERPEPGRWALSPMGRDLTDEHHADELHLGGAAAKRELAVLALLSAVRTGRGDFADWFGGEYAELVAADSEYAESRIGEESYVGSYIAKPTASVPGLSDHRRILVSGRGAGALALALLDARADREVTVLATPTEIEAFRRTHDDDSRLRLEPGSPLAIPREFDAVLLSELLPEAADADARHILSQAAGAAPAVFALEDVLDPALAHEHDYEDDLIDFALHGGGRRTAEDHAELFATAGLRVEARTTIGWGTSLFQLVPAP